MREDVRSKTDMTDKTGLYSHILMNIYTYLFIYTLCIFIYIHVFTCFQFICIYIYMYTCIYLHTYVNNIRWNGREWI
jgi:hypothetical protein